MNGAINTILEQLKSYYANNTIFLYTGVASLIYLFIFEKRIRIKYVIPLMLIIFVVLNPFLYSKIFVRISYWRLFWIFSSYIPIGIALVSLLDKLKNDILKALLFCAVCLLIIFKGNNIFNNTDIYRKTISLEKLPEGIVEVCEKILSYEDEPKCINDNDFAVNARMYSSKIKQLWGRDALGFISEMSQEAKDVYELFYIYGDMYAVFDWAERNGYNSVVLANRIADGSIATMFGYEEVLVTEGDIIYHLYYKVGEKIIENGD